MSDQKLKEVDNDLKSLLEQKKYIDDKVRAALLEKSKLEADINDESEGKNKLRTRYIKSAPNDILPKDNMFFGYKVKRTNLVRWSISKKTSCMLIEFEDVPNDDELISKIKQAGHSFNVLPATQTVLEREKLDKDERDSAIAKVRLIYPNNSGFCSVCGYNNDKYVNYVRGFATCCPNNGSTCLEKLGKAFKAVGCAFYGDGHDYCDKKYW